MCLFFCLRLLAQLDETENAFEQFWSRHHLKLEQCLQLRHFEQDFREVRCNGCASVYLVGGSRYAKYPWSSWVDNQAEIGLLHLLYQVKVSLDGLTETLLGLSDAGDCVARVEHLLGDLKTLDDKAQVKIFWITNEAWYAKQSIEFTQWA